MNPHRNAQVDLNREAEETAEPLLRGKDTPEVQEILLEIGEDARRLKNRYLKETIVPEGGE
jgi:hypothetical protein